MILHLQFDSVCCNDERAPIMVLADGAHIGKLRFTVEEATKFCRVVIQGAKVCGVKTQVTDTPGNVWHGIKDLLAETPKGGE